MIYRGQVKFGVLIFEDALPQPDGSIVRVEVVLESASPDPKSAANTIWNKLKKYSGVVADLPPDMVRNQDH